MVSNEALAGMALSAMVSAALPIGAYLVARRGMAVAIRNVLAGALFFVLFARGVEWVIFESGPRIAPGLGPWLLAHAPVMALYGAVVGGVVEETGRYLGLRFLAKPRDEPATAVAYAIGHGGAEAIIVGVLGVLGVLAVGVLINTGLLESSLSAYVSRTTLVQMRGLEQVTGPMMAMGMVERLCGFIFQMALTLVMWRAVRTGAWWRVAAVVLAHVALNLPAWLVITGAVHLSLWVYEGIYAIPALGVLAILLIRFQPERRSAGTGMRSLLL